jgi:hypothetical protein
MVNYYMLITWLDIVLTISNQVAITGFEWFKMQVNPYQLWALNGLKDKQIRGNRGLLMV